MNDGHMHKVKIKLFFGLIKHGAMKECGRNGGVAPPFLALALDGVIGHLHPSAMLAPGPTV
jgi:hypothetical protein